MSGSRAPSAVFLRLAGVDMRMRVRGVLYSDGAGEGRGCGGRHANRALGCKGWAACGSWVAVQVQVQVQTDAGARGGSVKGRVCTLGAEALGIWRARRGLV
jgi:hypothetical protein